MSGYRNTGQGNLLVGVNEVADPDNLSGLERLHIPVITTQDTVKLNEPFDVTVAVGHGKEHPTEAGHFIRFIELYAGDTLLARTDFAATQICSCATFRVKLSHSPVHLQAYACCNLHGTWVGRKAIDVKE